MRYDYYGYPYNNIYPYTNMQGMRNIPVGGSFSRMPMAAPIRSGGLLSRIFPGLTGASNVGAVAGASSSFSFSNLLNGASKTLGVINQAIPVYNQIKPVWNNAKTMFRMAKAMNSNDTSTSKNTATNSVKENTIKKNEPTFFQ